MKVYKIYMGVLVLGMSLMIGCAEGGGVSASSDSANSGGTGVGGSMARFAISGDFLYTLNERELKSFDITEPEAPLVYTDTTNLSFDVETLFSAGDYLYVGGQSGMDIYDKKLKRLGSVSHFKSCDPVVVQDNIAYVTLNTSNSCRIKEGTNALQVYDVKDPFNPHLIYTQEHYISAPTGVGIDGDVLFVCDGHEGLKLFDVNKTEGKVSLSFNRHNAIADINCYDLIPHKNLLIVSNGADVRQFDYSHLPMVEHNSSR